MPATRKPLNLQPIERDKIYPLRVFEEATGWGRHALRQARRAGLKTITAGGRKYVRGEDFFAYMASLAEAE